MKTRRYLGWGAVIAAALAPMPAAATIFLWAGPASFATATQSFAPVWADTLQFTSGAASVRVDGPLAFLNVRVTRAGGGGSVSYRRSFAVAGGDAGTVSLSALGPLTIGGGMIGAISLECALCTPGSDPFQGFGDTRFALIDSAAAPRPQSVEMVPEPSTWAAMLVGFGAVGLLARARRRQRTAPVAA